MNIKLAERHNLQFIFWVALLSTVWSLYYGYFGDPIANIATGDFFNPLRGMQPCALCWYGRVFMYPIVLLSGLALLRADFRVVYYIFPLTLIWTLITGYQVALENHWVNFSGLCVNQASVSCGTPPVEYFWFLTLAGLGLIAFVLMMFACYGIMMYLNHSKDSDYESTKTENNDD